MLSPLTRGPALALAALFSAGAPAGHALEAEPLPYRLGQGLSFPAQQLNIGGYLNVRYSDLEGTPWQFGLHDLSLFISKTLPRRWQFFSEVELGDALQLSADGLSGGDSEVDLERLYADYRATPALTVRFGKYLTPVGRWNQIHADPLVWTPDRPLTSAAPFARHAAGAMVYGDVPLGSQSLDYSLYLDDSDLIDPLQKRELAFEDSTVASPPRNAFKRAAGARLAWHFDADAAALGISYLRMQMTDLREHKELFGADAIWTVRRMEFSGEWVYRNSLGPSEGHEHGWFVQAVLPLPARFYFIARHERYHAAALPPTATLDNLGLTWRPRPAISVKLEHRAGRHNQLMAPSGWLGSLAVLF